MPALLLAGDEEGENCLGGFVWYLTISEIYQRKAGEIYGNLIIWICSDSRLWVLYGFPEKYKIGPHSRRIANYARHPAVTLKHRDKEL